MKINRYVFSFALALSTYATPFVGTLAVGPTAFAQEANEKLKWTDISGARTIEAKFVRLDGDNVVLEKADGSEVTVPLNKLNLKSQAQAKRMANPRAFEKKPSSTENMKPDTKSSDSAAGKSTTEPKADAPAASAPNRVTLAKGVSAADTLKTVLEEYKKGNYGVVMDTMPPETTQLLTELISKASGKLNKSSFDSIKTLFKRSAKVMGEKKQFIMNYPKVPSEVKPRLSAHYDTLVSLLNDIVASPAADYKALTDGDVEKVLPVILRLADVYGTKFIETEKQLDPNGAAAKTPVFISLWNTPIPRTSLNPENMRIINENGDQAQLEFVGISGTKESINLQRIDGRWLGAETEITRAGMEQMKQQIAQVDSVDPAQMSGQLTLGLAVVGGLIGQLERAKTQEEFNQQMDQLFEAAGQMVPGGGVPGLPPVGP